MATAIAQPPFEDESDDQLGFQLPEEAGKLALEYIPRSMIHPDPHQPRKQADGEDSESVKVAGILQPISVRFVPPGLEGFCPDCARPWSAIAANAEYMIIFGERRWRSAEGVMETMPVIIRQDVTSGKRLRLVQLIENHGRKNLAALEDARAIRDQLQDDPKLSQNKLAKILRMPASTLKDRLALLRNESWLPLLESGEITTSQMVEVARYADRTLVEQQDAIQRMRDHQEQSTEGPQPIAEMEVEEFTRVLAIAFVDPTAQQPQEPAQTELETLAGPTAGGSDVALESGSGDPSNRPSTAPDSAAVYAARHHPMSLVFRSGLKASLGDEQRKQTLATQPDFFVSRSLRWVEQKLKDISAGAPPVIRTYLEWDKAVLDLEFKLRDAESGDAVAADKPTTTAGETARQESLDLPAHQSAAGPGLSGTAPMARTREGASSEATTVVDASAPVGRTEAGLPDPSTSISEAPQPSVASSTTLEAVQRAERKAVEQHQPRSTFLGLFSHLEKIVLGKNRPMTITVGPAKAAAAMRVTVSVIGKVPGIGNPLVIDGTATEIDAELPAYVAAYLAGKSIPAVKKPAAPASAPAAAAKPASPKKAKTSKKKVDKYKPVFPKKTPAKKKTAPKPVQKKATAKPAKVAKPKGLYPSQALADVIGSAEPIRKPKAIKAALAYAKQKGLVGSGALRNAISVDEKLRLLVGARPVVTMNELKRIVGGALKKEPQGASFSKSIATAPLSADAAPKPDPAQIDLVEEITTPIAS